MEKRMKIGGRIIKIGCSDLCMPVIYERFLRILRNRKVRAAIVKLMDKYKAPETIVVNFRKGKGDLYGQYFIYEDVVLKHLIVMDIYTKPFEDRGKNKDFNMDKEMLDTFVHELIHHLCDSERETTRRTKAFMKDFSDFRLKS